MTKFIKNEVRQIEISGIRKFNTLANQVDGVIKLTLGELDFDTPKRIKNKAIKALENNHTRYTTNKGINALRRNITKNSHYDFEEIILTVGTTEGLSTVIKTIVEEHDEIIIPTPGYVGYAPLIELEKGVVKELDTTKFNFKITKKALEETYTSKTKALLVTSPNNPTGVVLSDEEMDTIKEFVLDKDILLISDEIYHDISFTENKSFSTYPDLKQNLVVLNGFSKSHAMTGFRVGYILSDISLINEFVKVHQYSVTSTSTISQYAALEASIYKDNDIVHELKKRRDFVCSKLDELGINYIKPEGAFYVFFDISQYHISSEEYCLALLHQEKLALIPGEYFLGNNKNYVRLSYAANMQTLEKALQRIASYHQKNKVIIRKV